MPSPMTSTPPAPISDTRDRILDAAERLFVEHGFDGTSMRMITGAASANLAAVNYHFGGKDALVQEVFRRRLTALNQRRLATLDRLEAEAAGAPLKPSRIVEAFFGTALELAADTEHGGRTFMRLLARTYNEPNAFVRQFLAEEYAEVMDRFLGALFRALPEVPRTEILWRFHFMTGAMAFAIAGPGGLSELFEAAPDDGDPARLLPRLMSFLLGGLRAPLPDGGPQA
ncbi:MAG TPA: TetR family transcriptional regulator [Thauera sp.]|uniref:TetR/AcrR family transcriptional regulator n=1 Tax=Thauera sp. TaxID=1905334 RepID=UPI000FB0A648|nr:TetR family transcriptional regulator [Thauera sp.]RTL23822.1 MAG: TetR/AcrR family transcriptional regulator [Rhodocyclaceae bacterium]MCB1944513.1 TetR/AcrR family transcriptional regulator [Thauera sp.]MCP5226544.1 TetR/AcrR family transcriptional regulator [Thauera sp.]HPE05346.1 TetR family transcriptional regulator [Thauera sp.]HRV76499.1 TetR family transcriptional regulator [Thauera sp.]